MRSLLNIQLLHRLNRCPFPNCQPDASCKSATQLTAPLEAFLLYLNRTHDWIFTTEDMDKIFSFYEVGWMYSWAGATSKYKLQPVDQKLVGQAYHNRVYEQFLEELKQVEFHY